MAYKIIDIEGIGETYAAKLEAAGVKTPEDLLAACASAKGRKEMAEKTEISEKLILRWTNHANLQKKLEEVNAEKNLVNRVPSESELQKMIDHAKELEVTMTY